MRTFILSGMLQEAAQTQDYPVSLWQNNPPDLSRQLAGKLPSVDRFTNDHNN